MGVVYLAIGPDGDSVAVKALARESGDEFRARLEREAQLLAAARHPRLARFVAADVVAQYPWIAMEYVPGPSLASVTLPLERSAVRRLATGLADAVRALHSAGIVHRDIKPGNVVLTFDGPVLVDFGIAAGPDLSALTLQGHVIGTPSFMAPEQLRGLPLTPAVDVWGWGALLYYAATGRAPFGEGAIDELGYRIQHNPVDTSTLPEWLARPVEAALAKRPESRPSAAQLVRDTWESPAGQGRATADGRPQPSLPRRPPQPQYAASQPRPVQPRPVQPRPVQPRAAQPRPVPPSRPAMPPRWQPVPLPPRPPAPAPARAVQRRRTGGCAVAVLIVLLGVVGGLAIYLVGLRYGR
jgi:serine/threonine protein kinase